MGAWSESVRQKLKWSRAELLQTGGGAVAVLAIMVTVLALMGRVWWCEAGDLAPWAWDIWSRHTSQHLIDPYTFTHVLHGVMFYGILYLALGKWVSVRNRFLVAISFEGLWEIAENSDFIINRYREVTISLDYFGDSILNSVSDVIACASGFGLAAILPVWGSWVFFFATEIVLILWIRDSLIINIIMLIFPLESLKQWQMPK